MSNPSIQNIDTIPTDGSRCTDVFSDTLRGFAGVEQASYDYNSRQLELVYDPRVITPELALHLVHNAGQQASSRVLQCKSKSDAMCAVCAAHMSGELSAHFQRTNPRILPVTNYEQGKLVVDLGSGMPSLEEPLSVVATDTPFAPTRTQGISRQRQEILFTTLTAVFGLAAFFLVTPAPVMSTGLYILAYIVGGWYGLLDGFEVLKEKRLDVNLLMILAALGAAVIGQPAEGAMLLFLFSLSNTLQSYALDRSRKAIEKLLDLRPPIATVRRGSRVVAVPVEKLVIGDLVLVRPGERFPIDGQVVEGESEVNQAPITGESMPVFKKHGDSVFAGSVNGNGGVEIRVTRLAKDTTLARIVQMVEEAQAAKADTQRLLDRFEEYYAYFVLGGAVLLSIVPLAFNQPFDTSFYQAMTWLVVASPCALVISTPASILSAIANGARHGVLFKGGVHLEKTAGLKVIAFDKTGTLTNGKPEVVGIYPLGELEEREALRLAAAVEARSEHPLAGAITAAAREQSMDLPQSTAFRAIPGQGVEAAIGDRIFWVGGRRMFEERAVHMRLDVLSKLDQIEQAGQTAMLLYEQGHDFLAVLGVADGLRPDAAEMVKALKEAGIDRVVMLTGDNKYAAEAIARASGVDEFHASLLPQDKVTLLRSLQSKYGPVAMVGDGVNDAPALASADVGIAMGGAGTDVALETADVVLMSDDLHRLPHTLALARQAKRVVYQNLGFSLAVILLLIVTTFGADLPLPLGVVGHEGSTVLVVLNGLRLLAFRR